MTGWSKKKNIVHSLIDVGDDMLVHIVSFMQTEEWIQFSYTCKSIYELKSITQLMIEKEYTLSKSAKNYNFSNIKNLNISKGSSLIKDKDFVNLSNIHTLNMNSLKNITDDALRHLSSIESLNISKCSKIIGYGFKYLNHVHTLDVSFNNYNKPQDNIFSHLKSIKHLYMNECGSANDKDFQYLQGLKTLKIAYCNKITDKAFEHLSCVEKVDIYGTLVTDEALYCIPSVTSIRMCNYRFTESGISFLTNLKCLDLHDCLGIPSNAIQNLNTLQELSISGHSNITDEAILNLTNLTTLKITRDEKITDNAFSNLKSLISLTIQYKNNLTENAFKNLTNLTNLKLYMVKINDNALLHCKNLKIVELSECNDITGSSFKYLNKLHTIILGIMYYVLDDAFKGVKNVHTLMLYSKDRRTSEMFKHLKPNLKTLKFYYCIEDILFKDLENVTDLNLQTTIGLAESSFKYLTSLRKLRIEKNEGKITRNAFKNLSNVVKLTQSATLNRVDSR